MGVIDNSRKAVYGYDQRVEVFGSEGAVMDENDTPNNATYYGADGTSSSPCYKIMWDRYTMAFAAEQRAFAEAVINGTETQVTGEDGLAPILIAGGRHQVHEGRTPGEDQRDRGMRSPRISHCGTVRELRAKFPFDSAAKP